ncbi:hypothetical protein [Deinococcus sp.]|uniref:hypothetical protein n=1 Tax=Deinococcus sp. TaxID=47478 RepID=UPI003CC6D988
MSLPHAPAQLSASETEPLPDQAEPELQPRSARSQLQDEPALVAHDYQIPASEQPLAVYVDVDETLLRHYGARQIPIPAVIKQVKALYKQGAALYCWSSLGADYARRCAESCGVAQCFTAFLPKPQLIVDDQQPKAWRRILHVHPSQCSSQTTLLEYREALKKPRSV